MSLASFVKEADQNRVVIKFQLSPNLPILGGVNFETSIVPSFPVSSRKTTYDASTG